MLNLRKPEQVLVEVELVSISSGLYQQERELRNRILLRPIGLPDFGWEMFDKDSLHFIARAENTVVGCVVLYLKEGAGVGRLMQMAVDPKFQGYGIGKKMVKRLIDEAKRVGIKKIACHAQVHAVPFYEKCGFVVEGQPFFEAGIEHQHMAFNVALD